MACTPWVVVFSMQGARAERAPPPPPPKKAQFLGTPIWSILPLWSGMVCTAYPPKYIWSRKPLAEAFKTWARPPHLYSRIKPCFPCRVAIGVVPEEGGVCCRTFQPQGFCSHGYTQVSSSNSAGMSSCRSLRTAKQVVPQEQSQGLLWSQ